MGASQNVAGFEVYDPRTKAFGTGSRSNPTSANTSLFTNRAGFDAAILGGQVALFGGRNAPQGGSALDTIELYGEPTNDWTPVTQRLSTPRTGHTVTRFSNGDVIVIGGTDSNGNTLGSADLVSGAGVNAAVTHLSASLRTPRKNHTATLITLTVGSTTVEGVLVVGGVDTYGNPIASAEVYAPTSVQVPGVTPPGGLGGTAPTITQLNPNNGPVGTSVGIMGTGFSATPSQNIVLFNGVVTPVQSMPSSGELMVLVPQGASTGNVTVTVNGRVSNGMLFTINGATTGGSTGGSTGTGGTVFSGPPRIFILLPTSGPSFMPLGIGGANFDTGSIPYVNGMPSIALFNFSIQNIPLIGSVAVGFTIVPPGAPSGPGDVHVVYQGQTSNPFPFTVN
jgi:hypothetical protein